MAIINEALFNYLIEGEHSFEELCSFSLERGQESSKRSKAANLFRGTEKRSRELMEQCEAIVADKSKRLTPTQEEHFRANVWKLRDGLVASGDKATKRWAKDAFMKISNGLRRYD